MVYSPVSSAVDDDVDAAVPLEAACGEPRPPPPTRGLFRCWQVSLLASAGAALALAAAARIREGIGGKVQQAQPSFNSSLIIGEVATKSPPDYTCARYGCLDVRTTYACQCSHHCAADGNCCPDFTDACVSGGRTPRDRLGEWLGCPTGELPKLPFVGDPSSEEEAGPPMKVRVLSYNAEWWNVIEQLGGNGNSVAKLVATSGSFDFIGFQEFYDPWFGLTRPGFDASALLEEYAFLRGELGGPVGSVIAFAASRWSLISRGQAFVAEDQKGPGSQYFGKRIATWARFTHVSGGWTVFFMNHHGPLPIDSGGVCGGRVTAHNLVDTIVRNAKAGDAIILVGDFNAGSQSETIQQLSTRLHKSAAGTSYGGIDNIFTNLPAAATRCAQELGSGGSDHSALGLELLLSAAGAEEAPAASGAKCTRWHSTGDLEAAAAGGRSGSTATRGAEPEPAGASAPRGRGPAPRPSAAAEEEPPEEPRPRAPAAEEEGGVVPGDLDEGGGGSDEAPGTGEAPAVPRPRASEGRAPRSPPEAPGTEEAPAVPRPRASEGRAPRSRPEEPSGAASGGGGTAAEAEPGCAAFGCGGGFRPQHPCQCNPACKAHGNCCRDFHEACQGGPRRSAPPQAAEAAAEEGSPGASWIAPETTPTRHSEEEVEEVEEVQEEVQEEEVEEEAGPEDPPGEEDLAIR